MKELPKKIFPDKEKKPEEFFEERFNSLYLDWVQKWVGEEGKKRGPSSFTKNYQYVPQEQRQLDFPEFEARNELIRYCANEIRQAKTPNEQNILIQSIKNYLSIELLSKNNSLELLTDIIIAALNDTLPSLPETIKKNNF